MPTYEFLCADCGPFERWRSHRESGEEMRCPGCGAAAERVYSVPRVSVKSRAGSELRRLEEQGAEPRLERKSSPGDLSPGPRKSGGRPWQISH